MITDLSYEEAKAAAESKKCSVCGSGLLAPHLGDGVFGVKCLKDESHTGVQTPRRTKKLADGRIYDVQTQRPVDENQALAVPQTREAMTTRMREAQAVGLWPQKMSQDQEAMIVQVALAYGLDPFMSEIMPYQGRPFITIAGRRRKDADAGHQPSIHFRPLSPEERQMYEDAEVLTEGDLAGVCVLTTEWGSTVEAFAKVTKQERTTKTERGGMKSPVVAANPIEMVQKRAERRAREMAYGPIARPAGLDTQIRVIEEGDVVECQGREIPDANGDHPGLDMATGEIREPQESDTGDLFPPDEAPEVHPASTPVPAQFKTVVDAAGQHGLDLEAFCAQVLPAKCNTLEEFIAIGGAPKVAQQRLEAWAKMKQVGEAS